MRKERFLIGYACVFGLIFLSSCATYERNYEGELLGREEAAFLFQENAGLALFRLDISKVNNQTEPSTTTLKNFVQYRGIIPLLFFKPNCRELLPGEYSVKAWATESNGDGYTRKYGPYDFGFEARPGHLYRVDAQKKYQEKKKLWFLTLNSKPYYEINIEDITSSGKYQDFLEEVERK